MWKAQIDHFAASHRVIAADLRGFGNSSIAANVVTMTDHAEDLRVLIRKILSAELLIFHPKI